MEFAVAGGAAFGSALAYVTARRLRAAIPTLPDWEEGAAAENSGEQRVLG